MRYYRHTLPDKQKEQVPRGCKALQQITTVHIDEAMKGEPHRFVQTTVRQNNSWFETWRALHVTYNQGQQAQMLSTLQWIMNPSWSKNQNNARFIIAFTR
eukprot:6471786-Amphidinium_carterae.3